MKTVTVVGAGFSGLTLAYELRRRGFVVRVIEAGPSAGGLISSRQTKFGTVESAANAILLDDNVRRLFDELQVPPAKVLKTARRKLIYWNSPRRWPVSLVTSFRIARLMIEVRARSKRIRPQPAESVKQWARRVVDADFEERLLSPALQGIYASDSSRLSANLVLKNFLSGRRQGRSSAPAQGMGQLIQTLVERLRSEGTSLEFGRPFELPQAPDGPTVIATSAWTAAEILRPAFPKISAELAKCEALPIATATAFFHRQPEDVHGFGCLFPRGQGFQALGALFNSDVFAGRSEFRSETWIFGETESVNEETLLKDRQRLTGRSPSALAIEFKKYPRGLPNYTVEWAQVLGSLQVPAPLFLHGNYLGQLGLSGIYARSIQLADQIRERYG